MAIEVGLREIRTAYTMMNIYSEYAFIVGCLCQLMGSEYEDIEEWLRGCFIGNTGDVETLLKNQLQDGYNDGPTMDSQPSLTSDEACYHDLDS